MSNPNTTQDACLFPAQELQPGGTSATHYPSSAPLPPAPLFCHRHCFLPAGPEAAAEQQLISPDARETLTRYYSNPQPQLPRGAARPRAATVRTSSLRTFIRAVTFLLSRLGKNNLSVLYATCLSTKHTDWCHCTSVLGEGCSSACTGTSRYDQTFLGCSQQDTGPIHTVTGRHQLICSGVQTMKSKLNHTPHFSDKRLGCQQKKTLPRSHGDSAAKT